MRIIRALLTLASQIMANTSIATKLIAIIKDRMEYIHQ